jgi:hypothetical protein
MKNPVVLKQMIELLDLPDTAYEKAKARYDDLGEWFEREDSKCSAYSPHIFPQGSFRLGTAIRPLNNEEEYDLDLACKLREEITKSSHSQFDLKQLIGSDLEAYRQYRGIQAPLDEKHRCWRLEYQDDLSFHMDVVPGTPEEEAQRILIKESMVRGGEDDALAGQVTQYAMSITDDRHPSYRQRCNDWLISNPEGYARWFESRMRLGETYLQERAMEKAAKIDDLQYYQWKTPLQRCIQLLKRHRDEMFKNNPDSKPISVIITTLAGRAYRGESDIGQAMDTILRDMDSYIQDTIPRVPNPVNPVEDFADRWAMHKYAHLQLEENFHLWLTAARAAFDVICNTDDISFITKQAKQKFALTLNEAALGNAMGISGAPTNVYIPKQHKIEDSSKPWKA